MRTVRLYLCESEVMAQEAADKLNAAFTAVL
jgi:hypothetical protein